MTFSGTPCRDTVSNANARGSVFRNQLNLVVYRTHPFIAEKFSSAALHYSPLPGFMHFPDFRISLFQGELR